MTTRDPGQIRSDIERTREQLGETVEALAHKTDLKTQARARLDETRARFRRTAGDAQARMAGTASGARAQLSDASPEQARDVAATAAEAVRRRPLPYAAGGAFALGLLVGRMLRRR
jgi:ElaB/YqjD/DUF883 family membrane-anchored ribosome-binding protein